MIHPVARCADAKAHTRSGCWGWCWGWCRSWSWSWSWGRRWRWCRGWLRTRIYTVHVEVSVSARSGILQAERFVCRLLDDQPIEPAGRARQRILAASADAGLEVVHYAVHLNDRSGVIPGAG